MGGGVVFKILDLFSGTQSVKKGLDLLNIEYEYYGIDIYSPEEENIILDLSQDNIVEKLLELLPKDWKPDFIWASPVCNKFSIATAVKGGTVYFEKIKNGIKPRENLEPLQNTVYKNVTIEKIKDDTSLHLKLVENMQKILDHYNTDFVIENPRTSYISYFLNPLYVKNEVDYCMYGYEYQKATSIYSNYVLNLKRCNHKGKHETKLGTNRGNKKTSKTTYAERSSVPPLLIQEILKHFIKEVE